jgi:hypothetical protein
MSLAADILKKYVSLIDSNETPSRRKLTESKADKDDAADSKKVEKEELKKSSKNSVKADNVKESVHDFFRRYIDIISESGDDDSEDPDVKVADSVKGKDGKTQSDAEKKLPPWLKGKLDSKDREAEEKGAKKAKREKL